MLSKRYKDTKWNRPQIKSVRNRQLFYLKPFPSSIQHTLYLPSPPTTGCFEEPNKGETKFTCVCLNTWVWVNDAKREMERKGEG